MLVFYSPHSLNNLGCSLLHPFQFSYILLYTGAQNLTQWGRFTYPAHLRSSGAFSALDSGFIKVVPSTSTRWRCAEEHRNALEYTEPG
ncbi:hypothetical protein GDO81_019597 [Engystomops pustulosus]|uniref:Uncharacterized protein n=1 Tax=Engystomops pustulosus TaxID=76066 RepID=A0AAV6YGQ4_ENGPU|nr:hypothetical protein GDO81_019597 [Engystomops pustulosus]